MRTCADTYLTMNELERIQANKRDADNNYLRLKHLKELAVRCRNLSATDLDRTALRVASHLIQTRNHHD